MENVALRELRNNTSEVLRRVEGGERVLITVDRRPVAALVPLERRRSWVPGHAVWSGIRASQADAALRKELAEALPDLVDTP